MNIRTGRQHLVASHPNLRCLGGLTAADGRRVRTLRFLRAPALTSLAPHEASWLESLDPAFIIDFRGEAEAMNDLVTLPPAIAARRLPLSIVPAADNRMHQAVASGNASEELFRAIMIETYRDFVRVHGDIFRRFLRVVDEAGERPVMFHCTAGKDRTGLAAALLLTALGVPREAVMTDYLATSALWTPPESVKARLPEVAHRAVFTVEPAYLDAALEEIENMPGGIEDFLHDAFGGADARARFADRHLEAA